MEKVNDENETVGDGLVGEKISCLIYRAGSVYITSHCNRNEYSQVQRSKNVQHKYKPQS